MRRVWAGVVLAALGLPAAAADLTGTWVHVGDRLGIVIGHVEELAIAPDGGVTVRVHRLEPLWRDDCAAAAPPPDCALAVTAARGRLELDTRRATLRIAEVETVTPPFVHPLDSEGWALIATANGSDWSFRAAGDLLELEGTITVEGERYGLAKLFHRVPDGFAADWLTVTADLLQLSLARSGCALDAALADPAARPGVFATVGAAARVRRGLTEAMLALRQQGADPRAIIDTVLTPFGVQSSDPAAPVAAPPGFDPADWAATVGLMRWLQAGEGRLDLILPEAAPRADEVLDCLEEFG